MMPRDPGLDPSSPLLSDQRLPRVARPIEAHYTVAGARVPARIEDLSEGGAYLDTLHPLKVGTRLLLEAELPTPEGTVEPLRLDAEVVWTKNGLGAGIAFLKVDYATRASLRYYLASALFGHLT